jgi:hypothetical protein
MGESNKIVKMKYYYDEEELDVFLNGEYQFTIKNAFDLPYKIVEFLEKIGIKDFEKQTLRNR